MWFMKKGKIDLMWDWSLNVKEGKQLSKRWSTLGWQMINRSSKLAFFFVRIQTLDIHCMSNYCYVSACNCSYTIKSKAAECFQSGCKDQIYNLVQLKIWFANLTIWAFINKQISIFNIGYS